MKAIWNVVLLVIIVCFFFVHNERETYIDGYIIRMSYKPPRVVTKSIVTMLGQTLIVNSISNYAGDKYCLIIEEINGRTVRVMVSKEEYDMYKENNKVQKLFKNRNIMEVEQ